MPTTSICPKTSANSSHMVEMEITTQLVTFTL